MSQRIIHITDTHLSNSTGAKQMKQQFSPDDKLQLVFDDIDKNINEIDFIVITGDLIHEGNRMDYKFFKKYIDEQSERLGVPIYVTLGNHDRTPAFFEGYLKQKPKNKYYYKVSGNDYDYYFLDTKHGNIEQGYLSSDQLFWLSKNINKSDKKSLLFMHHPIYGAPLKNMKYSILQNGNSLLDVIHDTNVKAIFSGHVHYPSSYIENGVLNVIGDSTAYHIDCRKDHDHVYKDSTSYNVVDIEGDDIGVNTIYLISNESLTNTVNGHIKVGNTDFVDKVIFE